ncbi:MAG: tRNA (N(6)-L-threonylcarbamoyladenosine(37)-C(2))-methylthiotransferase MtaB [Rhizobiales bacterium]|nr:tRNA (N(6)-L-threonylcarbamoyladenosine(37)-C(2))-methylthiotransferase MtaB [Hyphomicrobiales bacterium]OJY41325.1 MAG: tRNA (N(6)-L-threonylcarbamoyladenosine(37)-C(2))-methylthiotransferase MtaB [Rhizobiales bacterium 64-17]
MTIDVVTFGCRLNIHESEVMRRHAAAAGVSDTVVVNTCAVTAEAVRQARQTVRRLRRERPDARIVVTGCAAQTEPAQFAAMPEVDLVLGNQEKLDAAAWRALPDFGVGAEEKIVVNDIMAVRETALHLVDGIEGHTRAFVQMQTGCDHRCTFCIIPYGRGPSRSVPMGEVVAQIRALVGNGCREVVLTGVDITSYGENLPGTPKLGALVKQILKHVPDLPRLRLSSIDSVEADDDLLDALAGEARLMPHLHLSLQAGDDLILKRMKRRHLRADAIAFTDQVRRLRPDVIFGADIIAGFPTETEAMFARSLDLVRECGLTHLHVFPFSPRPGTPAARMPAVTGEIVKERAKRLRALGATMLRKHLDAQVGQMRTLLSERGGIARTEQFTPVALAAPIAPGLLIDRVVTGHDGRTLRAA